MKQKTSRLGAIVYVAAFVAIAATIAFGADSVLVDSGKYISDLERKYLLITSVREDVSMLRVASAKKPLPGDEGHMPAITGRDIEGMMPMVTKMGCETRPMVGSLSPDRSASVAGKKTE